MTIDVIDFLNLNFGQRRKILIKSNKETIKDIFFKTYSEEISLEEMVEKVCIWKKHKGDVFLYYNKKLKYQD